MSLISILTKEDMQYGPEWFHKHIEDTPAWIRSAMLHAMYEKKDLHVDTDLIDLMTEELVEQSKHLAEHFKMQSGHESIVALKDICKLLLETNLAYKYNMREIKIIDGQAEPGPMRRSAKTWLTSIGNASPKAS